MIDFLVDNADLVVGFLIIACIVSLGLSSLWQKKNVKVLHKGNKHLTWSRIKCKYCDSELEFLPEYVKETEGSSDESVEIKKEAFIICPVCGKKIFINQKDINNN